MTLSKLAAAPVGHEPQRRRLMLALGASLLLPLSGCAATGLVMHEHPLVGRIHDVAAARGLDRDELLRRLREADVVLLGETHDNPQHHRLQLEMLRALAQGRRPALAMEQFDVEHQAAIDAARSLAGADAEALADAGRFAREGWNWPLYEPLVAEAAQRKLDLVAINLSRGAAREVARDGFTRLPLEAARELVEPVWNAGREQRLAQLITAGHCNNISPEVRDMIVRAQRGRDAVMAAALAPRIGDGAVVILGRGHARRDIGVPIYLERIVPAARVLSVGMVEVEEGRDEPAAYEEVREGAYDLAWFTPRFVRPDPCELFSAGGMKRSLSK